ncbi:MAG: hypothetical protein LJE92_17750 [Gammaproteobacteria bacterium]|jgi:hypothetical protein|nr:hypothetical protein [Gammaproteobacteria bacterium]
MNKTLAIKLDAGRTTIILTAIMSALLVTHVLAMQANFNESLGWKDTLGFEYWQIAIFDLDEEESFGTWFSAVILLFASVLLFFIAACLRSVADTMHRWWTMLGLGFGLMSIDEVVGLHELFNSLYENLPWTTAGFILFVLAGFCFLPFLWHYRWRTAGLFLLAGIIYASGVIGIEHYSGTDINSLGYNMLTGLEEGLEMSGVILLIYTLLDFIGGLEAD